MVKPPEMVDAHGGANFGEQGLALKPRERRRNVMIQARMRAGASWSDACILNLSSRGMLVKASNMPSRGSYLEIRRGSYVIVARVVWANAGRFGVQTQDLVPAEGLINHPDRPEAAAKPGDRNFADRRTAARPSASRHEASRWRARASEFCVFALLGAAGAMAALGAVDELLARPLAVVETALKRS
jgi:hypothetical protein